MKLDFPPTRSKLFQDKEIARPSSTLASTALAFSRALPFRHLLVIGSMTMTGMLVGCGKAKQPWEVAHPTVGVVKIDGQPLANAQITLVPEDSKVPDTVRPRGFTDNTGSFELSTYGENDGAPVGKYKLLAMRFPVIGTADNPSQGPNDLPPKYSRADTSDVSVEIEAQENDLSSLQLRR